MNFFLVRIGRIAIFLICAQTILHFRAKSSYEKYIKLLISMMLLILLMEPVMGLFGKRESKVYERIQIYQEELENILEMQVMDNEQISDILAGITKSQMEQVNTEITSKKNIEEVENVMIEVGYGESAKNNGEVSLGTMVSER